MCFTSRCRSIPLLCTQYYHYITSSFVETLSRDDRGCDTPRRFHDSLRLWLLLWVSMFCCWMILAFCFSCLLHHTCLLGHTSLGSPSVSVEFGSNSPHSLTLAGARSSSNTIFNALCSHHLTGILTLVHTLVIFALQLMLLVLIIFRFFFSFRYVLCFSL